MNKFILATLTVLAISLSGCGDGNQTEETSDPIEETTNSKGDIWMTNFELAQSQAKINNKPILLSFSGSDWCGWCIKLDKEVFDTQEFKDWAKDNLILVNLDFPRNKSIPADEKAQNEKLYETFDIEGFPTVILLNSDGKVIGRTGYQTGGAAEYIKHLKSFIK